MKPMINKKLKIKTFNKNRKQELIKRWQNILIELYKIEKELDAIEKELEELEDEKGIR